MTIDELMNRAAELRMRAISSGLLRLAHTIIVIDPNVHDNDRHLAACCESASEILIAPQLAAEPSPVIDGILMHELGHAADFAYPGRLLLRDNGVEFYTTPRKRSAWKRRDPYEVEIAADRIAEALFDVRIGYVGDRMLQSTEGGVRPRPFGI